MKNLVKALLVSSGAALLVFCNGCAPPSSDAPESDPVESSVARKGLESVDVCSILTPTDLEELGLDGPGDPADPESSEPGCDYSGDAFDVAVYKNQGQTVESYGQKPGWAHFDRVSIDGRNGAQCLRKKSVGADLYDTMFDAGGGVIIVTVQEFKGAIDERAESLKLAERIAPRLPR